MAIPEDILERIKEANDLVSVARQYLPDLKKAGRDWKCCCPFHYEKTPSFSISPEREIFKCFGCGQGGDVFKFVMSMENISWIEAVKKLAERASIEIPSNNNFETAKISKKSIILKILETTSNFYHQCLLKSSKAKTAREYLKERGVNSASIEKFRLGFAPKGLLLQAALKTGYTKAELIEAGILTTTQKGDLFEYMSDRLVFPIFDAAGNVVGFGGRTLDETRPPKYINTPETIVFSKSGVLYGLFQTLPTLRTQKESIIVEGYMDALISWQFGISGVVAPLSTALTDKHAKLISRYSNQTTVLFDPDPAGQKAVRRALEIFEQNSMDAVVSTLPENIDPDQYLNSHGKENFLALLKSTRQEPIDFLINQVLKTYNQSGLNARMAIVSDLLNFAACNPNVNAQMQQITKIAQRFNVDEKAIRYEFSKLIKQKRIGQASQNQTQAQAQQKPEKDILNSLQAKFLNLLLFNRTLVNESCAEFFTEDLFKKIFESLILKKDDAHIMNTLSDEERLIFTKLTASDPRFSDASKAYNTMINELQTAKLKMRLNQIKQEVSLMINGKIEKDMQKLKEYEELTLKLKGAKETAL